MGGVLIVSQLWSWGLWNT